MYQHIVLLVQHGGKWGAFGISRCPDLMNKDLIFDRLYNQGAPFLGRNFLLSWRILPSYGLTCCEGSSVFLLQASNDVVHSMSCDARR